MEYEEFESHFLAALRTLSWLTRKEKERQQYRVERPRRLEYVSRNCEHLIAYKRDWNKRNREKLQALKIKHQADLPLHRIFVELDACAGYEKNVIGGAKSPLELLIEKEES